jgi:hypothetical protein
MLNTTRPARRGTTNKDVWGGLDALCRKVHTALYVKHDRQAALRYVPKLERVVAELPKNHTAILKGEAEALLEELRGNRALAIKHRKREIQLIRRLHESVYESVAEGRYGAQMARSILKRWDLDVLESRRNILRQLQGHVDTRAG